MAMTVLAVDDLHECTDLIRSILKNNFPDCKVYSATSGQKALQLAYKYLPDLIILDAKMPKMDGFKVCQKLKADPTTNSTPVLMISAILVESKHKIEALNSGADGLLCKPFETPELISQVKALLRLKQYADRIKKNELQLEKTLNEQTTHLQESETRFKSVFENSPDAIVVHDEKGSILDVNPAACQLHGYSKNEIIGNNVRDLFPVGTNQNTTKAFSHWLKTKRDYYEGNCAHANGSTTPVEVRGSLIHYTGIPATLLQIRDISRRKKVENALRCIATGVSEQTGASFYFSLAQNLSQALETDCAFISTKAPNDEQMKTIALWEHDGIRENISYPFHDAPCSQVYGQQLQCYPEDTSSIFPDCQMLEKLHVEGYLAAPLFDSKLEPLGVIGVMHGQAIKNPEQIESLLQVFSLRAAAELERQRDANELWESKEKYRSLTDDVLDTSTVGIFIHDAAFRIVWMNQTLENYLGLDRKTIISKDKRKLVSQYIKNIFEDPITFEQDMLKAYETSSYDDQFECHVLPTKTCKERWLDHWSQPIRSGLYAGGRIEYYADITERRKLEQQLLQAQKMESIGRLAGGIAHDFNNLLTSILGFSRLLLDEVEHDQAMKGDVLEIIQAGERAAKLTRQLLTFGRRQMIQVEPLDINEIVVHMVQLLRRTLGEDIELVTLLEEKLPSIEADSGQIEQIIMNLAVNARDAMPKGGKLTIQTIQTLHESDAVRNHLGLSPGKYLKLSIRDTGMGMSKEIIERAFEPFFTTKDVGKGTGLGLATVYGIVTQFKGSIEIDSTPNLGTTFNIYFPSIEQPPVQQKTTLELQCPRGSETILVVEDEETVRHLTVRILKAHGYKVLQARLGSEAIEVCNSYLDPIDLLLTDVVMPQMSGPKLVEALLKTRPDIKILFTSGFTQDAILDHGVMEQDIQLLTKPYTRERLTNVVREVLEGNGKLA